MGFRSFRRDLMERLDKHFSRDDVKRLNKAKSDLYNSRREVKSLQTRNSALEADLLEANMAIEELKKPVVKKPEVDPLEKLWNNKRPKVNLVYKAREGYDVDVRNYYANDPTIPKVGGFTNDQLAAKALNFVKKNVKYTSDKGEHWKFPFETLQDRKGDCEDGAILMANIMLNSGVPYWRIRLNAGRVKGGGHAWVTYLRESDNQWVILDWCYWSDSKVVKLQKLYKDAEKYYTIWFSWNYKYTFQSPDLGRE